MESDVREKESEERKEVEGREKVRRLLSCTQMRGKRRVKREKKGCNEKVMNEGIEEKMR